MPATADIEKDKVQRKYLVSRFWRSASGFWSRDQRKMAWLLTALLIAIIAAQVYVFYRINVWNRELFDALEKRIPQQSLISR